MSRPQKIVYILGKFSPKARGLSGTIELTDDGLTIHGEKSFHFAYPDVWQVELTMKGPGTAFSMTTTQGEFWITVPRFNIRGWFVTVNRNATRRLFEQVRQRLRGG